MKKEPDGIRNFVSDLAKRPCPACGGQDREGDTSIHKLESSSGSYYDYVIICCMGCQFMSFYRVSSTIQTENRIVRSPINYPEQG